MTLQPASFPKNPTWGLFQAGIDVNANLMEFTLANIGSTIECAGKLSRVRSVPEYVDVLTNHTRDRFNALSEQAAKLSAVVTKASEEVGEEVSQEIKKSSVATGRDTGTS